MIAIREVKTRREQREFLEFPLRLYKGNPCFVPPLYADEKKMFRKDYVYSDCCQWVCYNAYRDGEMVGRIQGIIQEASNRKNAERRARFNRFDAIDDPAVSRALFEAVETCRQFPDGHLYTSCRGGVQRDRDYSPVLLYSHFRTADQ